MATKWRIISPAEAEAHPLYGVGGWLVLLVAGMLVLGPLFGTLQLGAQFNALERQYPALVSSDAWSRFKTASWVTFLVIAALNIYGGWGLARGKEWSVVTRAKVILWISGPLGSLVMGVLVPIITLGRASAVDSRFVGSFLASVIAAAIWTTYLSRSKRVRITYEHSVRTDALSESLAASQQPSARAAPTDAKGRCPNCEQVIPLESEACPQCHALFTGDGWKVLPL
jgi:Protein of unknown function (DUF2569)